MQKTIYRTNPDQKGPHIFDLRAAPEFVWQICDQAQREILRVSVTGKIAFAVFAERNVRQYWADYFMLFDEDGELVVNQYLGLCKIVNSELGRRFDKQIADKVPGCEVVDCSREQMLHRIGVSNFDEFMDAAFAAEKAAEAKREAEYQATIKAQQNE